MLGRRCVFRENRRALKGILNMRGIAGYLEPSCQSRSDAPQSAVIRIAATLCHRSQDVQSVWVDVSADIVLDNRRLSIVDISSMEVNL